MRHIFTLIAVFTATTLCGEQTLAIIKPDGVKNKHIGEVLTTYEQNGLKIAGLKMIRLSPESAQKFYAVHKDRPFYNSLVEFMTSGPVVVIALEGENAVAKNRELMGSTNPKNASPETLRARFAESMERNTVHGSDSQENGVQEVAFFFKPEELVN